MNRSLVLAGLFTALWCLGSVWYYDCRIKRVCGPESGAVAAVTKTPSLPAPAVTAAAPAPFAVENRMLTVYFGRKSTDIVIPAASQAQLSQLLDAVRQGRRVVVVGHSDGRGSAELKAKLAAQRAVILRDWLLQQGVPAAAIAAVESHEDREPVADNATVAGRAKNRRAVATLQE